MLRNTEAVPAQLAVAVGVDEEADARSAVRRALGVAYAALPQDPGLVILFCTSAYPLPVLLGAARVFTGPTPLIGGTSGSGLMSGAGVVGMGGKGTAVAAMAIAGGGVAAGVGHADLDADPRAAGESAARAAMTSVTGQSDRPRAAIIVSPPGHEETLLQGVAAVVGRGVPLFGCTVADEQVAGRWAVFAGNHVLPNAVAVAVLYGEFLAGTAFSGGYWPTARAARAEKASGRMLEVMEGRPAASVYAGWLGVASEALRGQGVRSYAAASPLAVEDARTSRLLIKEPGTVAADGSVGFFADLNQGDCLRLLTSTPESLVAAAGAATSEAMMRAGLRGDQVRGVLVAQGAGRVLALRERANEVPLQLRRLIGAAPMLGCATFGEQSALADGRPVHLNLTASVLVLGG